MTKVTYLFFFVLLITTLTLQTACKWGRAFTTVLPTERSYKMFPADTAQPAATPFKFAEVADKRQLGNTLQVNSSTQNPHTVTLRQYLTKRKTLGFTIIRNDSILYEDYFRGYDKSSIVSTFSIAKSFVGLLVGIAIDKGLLKLTDPITNYMPELDANKLGTVTIEHLLRHTSGIKFKEAGHFYYGRNVLALYSKRTKLRTKPGTNFYYDNGNTQTLGIILERVFKKPLTKIMEEEIWKPIGAESPITWSIDSRSKGIAKAFCCLNGRLMDFARFGRIYMNNGNIGGKQIVSKNWLIQSSTPDRNLGGIITYKYQLWLGPKNYAYVYAAGLYGQYVVVYPPKNLIIVQFIERNAHKNADFKVFLHQLIDQL